MHRFLLLAALVAFSLCVGATAQPLPVLWGPSPETDTLRRAPSGSARYLSLDDPAYRWIARLQRRGHLLSLNPTALPYTEAELARALATLSPAGLSALEQRWADGLAARLRPSLSPPPGEASFGLDVHAGAVTTNNERLDPVRFTDAADPILEAGEVNLYPNASFRPSLEAGPVVAQLGLGFNMFYRDDPDGIPLVKELAIRNEESSVGVALPWVDVRIGNGGRHWGLPDGDAVFISSNPRSYDAITLRLGNGTLALRSMAAELDAALLDGTFTGRAGGWENARGATLRRFLVAHRIDWRPRPWLTIAFMEQMLSSGQDATLSFPAIIPTSLHVFLNDSPPKNYENNNIIGGLFSVQRGRVSVTGQLAMDDFDVLDRLEPASIALTGDLIVAGSRADIGLALTAVTARAYDTGLPEQSFLYGDRGIATQFSDYLHTRLVADVYLDDVVAGLTVRPEMHLLVQGERDIRQPWPTNDEVGLIFTGTPERTVRAGMQVRLQPSPWWWVQADLGVNHTANDGFVDGASATRFVGFLEGGARLRVGTPVRLTW